MRAQQWVHRDAAWVNQWRHRLKGPHRAVAKCNDCHTPPGFIPKYLTKAENGYHHSLAFTTGNFHQPIQIKGRNPAITEQACRKCYAQIVSAIKAARAAGRADAELAPVLDFQRKAQFYLDFIEAENSIGFHAPQKAARILAESIDFSRKGQVALRPAAPPATTARTTQ